LSLLNFYNLKDNILRRAIVLKCSFIFALYRTSATEKFGVRLRYGHLAEIYRTYNVNLKNLAIMKRGKFTIIFGVIWQVIVLIPLNSYSQDRYWEYLNPKPTANNLYSVYFTDAQKGFAVGAYNTILKTTNGGEIWSEDARFKDPSQLASTFSNISFINENDGYIAGLDRVLLTTNGGETWEVMPTGGLNLNLYSTAIASFYSSLDTGLIAGTNPLTNNYELRRTTDRGLAWTTVVTLPKTLENTPVQVLFSDPMNGWFLTYSRLFKTYDGGATWTEATPPVTSRYFTKIKTHGSRLYLLSYESVGGGSSMMFTDDDGASWSTILLNDLYNRDIKFTSDSVGYLLASQDGSIYQIKRTADGGQTWSVVYEVLSNDLRSLYFTDQHTGYAVGDYGSMLKITESGDSVSIRDLHVLGSIISWINFVFRPVFFNNTFYMADYYMDSSGVLVTREGSYLYSEDFGTSWRSKSFQEQGDVSITKMSFPSEKVGYIAATNLSVDSSDSYKSKIFKTTDGGNSWKEIYATNETNRYLRAIYFVNDSVGYAAGYRWEYPDPYGPAVTYGWVLRTTNGGNSWGTVNSNVPNMRITNLYFTSADTGYFGGVTASPFSGKVGVTTDGGVTWTIKTLTGLSQSVDFIVSLDKNTLFAKSTEGGKVFRSTNAGSTWTLLNTGQNASIGGNLCVSSDTVYTSVYLSGKNCYRWSADGGTTWTQEYFNQEGTASIIHFFNRNTGIAINSNIFRMGKFKPSPKIPVRGGGEYCQSNPVLPIIYLPISEYNVKYVLYRNGVPQDTLVGNTGTLTFGGYPKGTYTVTAENQNGVTMLADTVVITEIPTLAPINLVADETTICSNGSTMIRTTEDYTQTTWQHSLDGIMWSDVEGWTSDTLVVIGISQATYYRAITKNQCDSLVSAPLLINVDQLPAVGNASSASDVVCEGGVTTIELSYVLGNVQWQQSTDSLDWSNISGENSSSLVTPAINQPTYFRAMVSNGVCDVVSSNVVKVSSVQPVGTPGTITGNDHVCAGQANVVYAVEPIANATSYLWTLPTGATITAGEGTNEVTLSFADGAAGGPITVQGVNICGAGESSMPLQVMVSSVPGMPSAIEGPNIPVSGTTQVYSVEPVEGVSYNWSYPADWTLVSGEGTATITLTIGEQSGIISCTFSNLCGEGPAQIMSVEVQVLGIDDPRGSENEHAIYPNPSSGLIVFTGVNNPSRVRITVTDLTGKVLLEVSGKTTMDVSALGKGIYLVSVHDVSKISTLKLMRQ